MVESWQCAEGRAEHRRPAPHDRTCSFGRGTCRAADARYTSVDAWIGSEELRGLLVAQQAVVDQFAARVDYKRQSHETEPSRPALHL